MTAITIPNGTYRRLCAMEMVHSLHFPTGTATAEGMQFSIEDLTAIVDQLVPISERLRGVAAMIAELQYYKQFVLLN